MASKAHKKTRPLPPQSRNRRTPRLPKPDSTARPIWEIIVELGASVPESEWEKVPTDLAKNLHHYLHGAPKEEE